MAGRERKQEKEGCSGSQKYRRQKIGVRRKNNMRTVG